jgi:FkbM family methyltransferase
MINHWISNLNAAKCLARGSKWQRCSHLGLRYLKAMAFRYISYPLSQKARNVQTTTFFDCPMMVTLPAGMDLYLLGCKTHDSEIRLARFLLENLKPGQVFVDVGAHFGYVSLLAAALTQPHGQVLAFEPAVQNFSVLQHNAKAFSHITCFNQLVCDNNGTMTFHVFPVMFSEYNTMHPEAIPKGLHYHTVHIQGVRLDDVFSTRHIQPDWIKIDVEGAEPDVLRGLKLTLSGNTPPGIAMEYLSEKNQGHQEAVSILLKFGYRMYFPGEDGQLTECSDAEKYMADRKLDSENLIFLHHRHH